MATRMPPSIRCAMNALTGSDVLPPSASEVAPWATNSGSSTKRPIAMPIVKSSVSASALPPNATPSPAAAREPERISQRVPMTSVS